MSQISIQMQGSDKLLSLPFQGSSTPQLILVTLEVFSSKRPVLVAMELESLRAKIKDKKEK